MTIGMAIGLALTGTFAYFSDTETSSGNTFAAGTFDLKIRDGGQFWGDGITVAEWTMSNMVPGVSEDTGMIGIRNDGSITPDHVKIEVSYTCTEGPPTGDMDTVNQNLAENWDQFAKYLEIIYLKYYDQNWYIQYQNGIWSTVGNPPQPAGYTPTDWQITDGDGDGWISLKDFKNDPLDNLPPPGTNTLSPTWFEMTVKFHGDAPNALQGDTLTLTVIFTLNQHSSQ